MISNIKRLVLSLVLIAALAGETQANTISLSDLFGQTLSYRTFTKVLLVASGATAAWSLVEGLFGYPDSHYQEESIFREIVVPAVGCVAVGLRCLALFRPEISQCIGGRSLEEGMQKRETESVADSENTCISAANFAVFLIMSVGVNQAMADASLVEHALGLPVVALLRCASVGWSFCVIILRARRLKHDWQKGDSLNILADALEVGLGGYLVVSQTLVNRPMCDDIAEESQMACRIWGRDVVMFDEGSGKPKVLAIFTHPAGDFNGAFRFDNRESIARQLIHSSKVDVQVRVVSKIGHPSIEVCKLLHNVGPVKRLALFGHGSGEGMQFSSTVWGSIEELSCPGAQVELGIDLVGCSTATGGFINRVASAFPTVEVCGAGQNSYQERFDPDAVRFYILGSRGEDITVCRPPSTVTGWLP